MKLIHKNTRNNSFFKGSWDLPKGAFNECTVVTFENEECLLPKELFNEFFDLPERGYCKKKNKPNKRKFRDEETGEIYEVENPFVKYNYSRVISPTISEFKNHNTVDALDGGKSIKEFILNPLPEGKDFEGKFILDTRAVTGPKHIIDQLRDNNMKTAEDYNNEYMKSLEIYKFLKPEGLKSIEGKVIDILDDKNIKVKFSEKYLEKYDTFHLGNCKVVERPIFQCIEKPKRNVCICTLREPGAIKIEIGETYNVLYKSYNIK